MKIEKPIYRVGNQVRIVEPTFVERVGYPLTWPMLRDEVYAHPKLAEALSLFQIPDKYSGGVVDGICKALVRTRHFGGRERTIHTQIIESLRGEIATVKSIRTAMTGLYVAPSFSYGYDSEPEWEPGYLDKMKAHRLLLTDCGEIESIHVEHYLGSHSHSVGAVTKPMNQTKRQQARERDAATALR